MMAPKVPGAQSLRSLVARFDARVLATADARPFTNVNRPEDLAALGLRITAGP